MAGWNQVSGVDIDMPWADWRHIEMCGLIWYEETVSPANPAFLARNLYNAATGLGEAGVVAPASPIRAEPDACSIVADALGDTDRARPMVNKVSLIPGNFRSNIIPGPPGTPFVAVMCTCFCIPIPTFTKLPGQFAPWNGSPFTAMTLSPAPGAALLIENVFCPRFDPTTQLVRVPYNNQFAFSPFVKFCGYGMPKGAQKTMDGAVGSVVARPGGALFGIADFAAAPGMELSGFPPGPFGNFGPPVDFDLGDAPTGTPVGPVLSGAPGAAGRRIARTQTLVALPTTITNEDYIEVTLVYQVPQSFPGDPFPGAPGDFSIITETGYRNAAGDTPFPGAPHPLASTGIQWWGLKYKWVTRPYPQTLNTSRQLLSSANEGQPRT